MRRNPIPKCAVCGKPIVKMRRISVVNSWTGERGYYLDWSKATYCSKRCQKRAERRRKKLRNFGDILNDAR